MKKMLFLFFFLFFPIVVHAAFANDFETIEGEKIWLGWTYYESGELGSNTTGYGAIHQNDSVAFGRYQFHYKYDLKELLSELKKENENLYGIFSPFLNSNNFEDYFVNHKSEFVSAWETARGYGDEKFKEIQDELAYNLYYVPTKNALQKMGINLDDFGPVIRGTVWSISVRTGVLDTNATTSKTYKALVSTYQNGISNEEYLENMMSVMNQNSYDDGRWRNGQKNAAISAMSIEDRDSYPVNGTGGSLTTNNVDPYPNVFSKINDQYGSDTSCDTLFVNQDGEETELKQFLNDVFLLIKIAALVFVVVFSILDYQKALISSDDTSFKKANQKILKRIAIGIFLFILPDLLELLFKIFGLYDISHCGIG